MKLDHLAGWFITSTFLLSSSCTLQPLATGGTTSDNATQTAEAPAEAPEQPEAIEEPAEAVEEPAESIEEPAEAIEEPEAEGTYEESPEPVHVRRRPEGVVYHPNGRAPRVVPRVMFWQGKVNQHFDLRTNTWRTDPDGVSGAELNKLSYCRKFYPRTVDVVPYAQELSNDWRDRGNLNRYSRAVLSFHCVQP